MSRGMICLAITLVLSGAAVAQKEGDPVQKEKEKLQGTWVLVTVELGGIRFNIAEKDQDIKMVFAGDKLVQQEKDKKNEGKFTLDPGKKPKQMDFIPTDEKKKGTLWVYELDADKLRICTDEGKRPKEVKSVGTVQVLEYKRMKP